MCTSISLKSIRNRNKINLVAVYEKHISILISLK